MRASTYSLVLVSVALLLTACGAHVNHRVSKGETLYSLGFKYNQDYRDIARWNGLSPPYSLHDGQWLRVAPPVTQWWEREYPERRRRTMPPPIAKAPDPRPSSVQVLDDKKSIKRQPTLVGDSDELPEFQWPVRGNVRINTAKKKGIDIYGEEGQPVYAAAEGKVVYSGNGLVGYGNLVIVKHGTTFLSAYAHNREIKVREGESVLAGQQIASMGSTGTDRVSLYFEIRENGEPVDPLQYLKTPNR